MPARQPLPASLAMPPGLCPLGIKAYRAIVARLKRLKCVPSDSSTIFYSPAQWLARGELYGTGSVLIVTHDGGAHAPCFNWDYCQQTRVQSMENALAAVGAYAEGCTCWYTAIYPVYQPAPAPIQSIA